MEFPHNNREFQPRVAVLIPCLNEEKTISEVVKSACHELGDFCDLRVYVYDNNSTDRSIAEAKRAGAISRIVPEKGKGNVVRRMFSDVEADVYFLVDGDLTYDLSNAREMVSLVGSEGVDLVTGVRVYKEAESGQRLGHRLGNRLFTRLVQVLFAPKFEDIFSGLRVMSRRFVKSFATSSSGFQIEAEMSIHAIMSMATLREVAVDYHPRVDGSVSKLSTLRDGFAILIAIGNLVKDHRPFGLFCFFGLVALIGALVLGIPIVMTYLETGLVPRLPTALITVGLTVTGILMMVIGLVLSALSAMRRENQRLWFLSHKSSAFID